MNADVAKENQVPLILIAVGLVIWIIVGFTRMDVGPGLVVLIVAVDASIRTILMVAAAFATAGLIGVSFGELSSAWTKFAAVVVLPGAIGALLPFGGGLIALFVAFGLLLWLFELEMYQAVVFVVLYWIISFITTLLIMAVFFG